MWQGRQGNESPRRGVRRRRVFLKLWSCPSGEGDASFRLCFFLTIFAFMRFRHLLSRGALACALAFFLAACAVGFAGCDSGDDSDPDGSSVVTVAGSDAASFRGNAVFVVDEDEEGTDVLVILFEGRPQDLDDDDDFVGIVFDGRSGVSEGDYDIGAFSNQSDDDDLLVIYQRRGRIEVGLRGDLDVTSSSSNRLSASYEFEAGQPFSTEPGTEVYGSFAAVRVDTTALPGLFDGDDGERRGLRTIR